MDDLVENQVWQPMKWPFSSQRLVENHAEAVDIAASTHLAWLGDLFGTHVGGRPHHRARLARYRARFHGSRQAEVGDLSPAAARLQQDVRRLDIAVHQAPRVGGGQSQRHLPHNLGRLLGCQHTPAPQPLGQGLAFQVLHDQVWQPQPRRVPHVMDSDDGLVPHRRCFPRLLLEPGPLARIRS
jgi:hypothetical protein